MRESNYELTKRKMQTEFLRYDQEEMIQKFSLAADERYLYLALLRRPHRIDRHSGLVEWSDDCFRTAHEADFNSAMTLYDLLCCSKPDCRLSGRFCTVNALHGTAYTAGLGEDLFVREAAFFDRHLTQLRAACAALGGTQEPNGDLACRLLLFPFFPVILRFWQGDEEFPASLKLLWDENTLQFLHYETTYYAANHLFSRLRAACRD